ncbi:transcription termination factor Rho [Amycolatopsis nigrescens]|uniref:transcription termination factor Rho n=1 Tax=Amycolatopsis nigrescens TaxID=381445 RepID=UPI00035F56DC|nr:transcription termination factor Rho [Amycolatopsis nigrescens]
MSNTDLLSGDVESQAASAGDAGAGEGTTATPKRRTGGLSGMVIADLRELATELGVGDTGGMRKGDLIAAIRERQGKSKRRTAANDTLPLEGIDGGKSEKAEKTEEPKARTRATRAQQAPAAAPDAEAPAKPAAEQPVQSEQPVQAVRAVQAPAAEAASAPATAPSESAPAEKPSGDGGQQEGQQREEGGRSRRRRGSNRSAGAPEGGQSEERGQRSGERSEGGDQRRQNDRQGNRGGQESGRGGDNRDNRGDRNQDNRGQQGNRGQDTGRGGGQDDDEDGGGRRGRRFRDRRRRGSGGGGREGGSPDTEIREDDVLLPVAGILDVLDNYAFVRTSGYLAGPNDVYVSLSLVRKFGLRRGDAITGVVRQPRDGEQQRQKFNPLVRVDSINGLEPDAAKKRAEFTKLTPLYPNERLRLETESHKLTTRVIDLVMPVGKGQRALIVSPPKAGKTTIMQDIANAITTNNPECHLMVVLVDERPEEVTDMQRSVKGEVIASTFDRQPSDHTSVAELAIERAKRLVEMGMDVVVLLDSITRLGRAYNLAAPASGRILSGGVDSTALFPPKRFLGAARNIENGGSLTIFATAMVETGSTGDTVIFEEFKGTGNAELKLDRKIAERRVFPAVDVNPSSTRKEELLLPPDELAVVHKLNRVLHALDSQQAIDLLISRLRKTKTNIEFLMQVSKTALGPDED